MQNKAIKVSIYGSEYLIRAGEDSAHIEQLAQYVDEKMREVNQDGALKSPLKVAILAALNIADEYYKSREEYSSSMKSL